MKDKENDPVIHISHTAKNKLKVMMIIIIRNIKRIKKKHSEIKESEIENAGSTLFPSHCKG